jgi:hypothetical protein
MEKQILLDQLDDRIKRALSLIIMLYPKLLVKELEIEEANGLLEIVQGLQCFITVVNDIQYNDNIQKYKNDIYGIAREDNE